MLRAGGEVAPDDFAAMREVVGRRYRRVMEEAGTLPDLILIDGGKGQLTAAYEALEEIGLEHVIAIGIAKKEELLFTRDREEPLALPMDSPALHLLQRIRDEAHRFAVTFHRRARAMRDLRSELDSVPGIGPRRRKLLLTRLRQPGGRPPRDPGRARPPKSGPARPTPSWGISRQPRADQSPSLEPFRRLTCS